jgi:hypothetical protein
MTSYALINRRGEPRDAPPRQNPSRTTRADLQLVASGDGWSLVDRRSGDLVFSALGLSGRRRCLEYAHASGVLALVS